MKSLLNAAHYASEETAIAYVEARLWPDGPICPHCGTVGEATKLKGKTTRPGLWNCRACRKPFTVRMRTVFESSHIPLHIWLQTIYLFCSSKKGISTRQLQRTFGGSMKTAWFLGHRVREAMTELNLLDAGPLGGANQVVSDGQKMFPMATIEHNGSFWLVPEWLEPKDEEWITPARIICLDGLVYQDFRGMPNAPFDLAVNIPIPKSVLGGHATLEESGRYKVIERPPIRYRKPPSVH